MAKVTTLVILVQRDRIRLRNLTRSFHQRLIELGLKVEADDSGSPAVLFDKDHLESLDRVLMALANLGAAFESDPKDMASPAALMHLLRERGDYLGKFKECFWDESGFQIVEV